MTRRTSVTDQDLAKLRPIQLVGLTPIQQDYLHDRKHRFFVVPSGRRSRKTLISRRKTMLAAMRKPGRYFHGAPTRSQAKAIFWEALKRDTRAMWARTPNESDLIVYLLNGSEIHVVGLDKPQRTEGQPWHGIHVTEFGDTKKGAWAANLRPLLSDTGGWAILDGVPEGQSNHLYDIALYAAGGSIPATQAGIGSFAESKDDPEWCYYHWFSADVLTSAEIEAAQRELDPRMFRQEYEGSFEAYDGLAYHAFSRENILDGEWEIKTDRPVFIGMDFNFDPMAAVALQEDDNGGLVVFREFWFQNCDTDAACVKHVESIGKDRHFEIYPDPACQSRASHGAGKTDLVLIRQAYQQAEAKKYTVFVRKSHPARKDRMNAVNALFQNAAGIRRLRIAPSCKMLIKDLQRVTAEEFLNGNFKDGERGHITDALGYFAEYRFPIRNGQQTDMTKISF
jgi:hypothetical protein